MKKLISILLGSMILVGVPNVNAFLEPTWEKAGREAMINTIGEGLSKIGENIAEKAKESRRKKAKKYEAEADFYLKEFDRNIRYLTRLRRFLKVGKGYHGELG